MTNKPRICLEITDFPLHQRMKALAQAQGRTLKYIVEQSFKDYLEKYSNKDADTA